MEVGLVTYWASYNAGFIAGQGEVLRKCEWTVGIVDFHESWERGNVLHRHLGGCCLKELSVLG